MKFVLASNILEHAGFAAFLRSAQRQWPGAAVLVSGDLLNVFPEPGEDLEGSMFYTLFGEMIVGEMQRLVDAHFKGVGDSAFIAPLREMFHPVGREAAAARALALSRYERLLPQIDAAMGDGRCYFIPGNMDYPREAEAVTRTLTRLEMLDLDVIEIDGVRLGGLGGVPNTVHPFRGVAEISPYEMTTAEYDRRLALMAGVDVLVTHLSPEEYPALRDFMRAGHAKLLICRAPFNFARAGDYRGALTSETLGDARVIKVRPFDYPTNRAYMIDLSADTLGDPAVELFSWQAASEAPAAVSPGPR